MSISEPKLHFLTVLKEREVITPTEQFHLSLVLFSFLPGAQTPSAGRRCKAAVPVQSMKPLHDLCRPPFCIGTAVCAYINLPDEAFRSSARELDDMLLRHGYTVSLRVLAVTHVLTTHTSAGHCLTHAHTHAHTHTHTQANRHDIDKKAAEHAERNETRKPAPSAAPVTHP